MVSGHWVTGSQLQLARSLAFFACLAPTALHSKSVSLPDLSSFLCCCITASFSIWPLRQPVLGGMFSVQNNDGSCRSPRECGAAEVLSAHPSPWLHLGLYSSFPRKPASIPSLLWTFYASLIPLHPNIALDCLLAFRSCLHHESASCLIRLFLSRVCSQEPCSLPPTRYPRVFSNGGLRLTWHLSLTAPRLS